MSKKGTGTEQILTKLDVLGNEYDSLVNEVKGMRKQVKQVQEQLDQVKVVVNESNHTDSNGKKKKEKKEKDPNAPKKVPSNYFLFMNDERDKLKAPADLKGKALMDWKNKTLSQMWADNPKYKKHYTPLYEKLKEKYNKELEEYKKTKENGLESDGDESNDSDHEVREKDLSKKLKTPIAVKKTSARKPRAPPKIIDDESDSDILDNTD